MKRYCRARHARRTLTVVAVGCAIAACWFGLHVAATDTDSDQTTGPLPNFKLTLSASPDRDLLCVGETVRFTASLTCIPGDDIEDQSTITISISPSAGVTVDNVDNPAVGTAVMDVTFDTAGTYTITATATVEGQNLTASITRTAMELVSLTVRSNEGGNPNNLPPPVVNPPDTDLFVCEKLQGGGPNAAGPGTHRIKFSAVIDPSTPQTKLKSVWKVEGQNLNGTSAGNFAVGGGNVTITLEPIDDNNRTFQVKAGCDTDDDGLLDLPGEVTHQVSVHVLKADSLKLEDLNSDAFALDHDGVPGNPDTDVRIAADGKGDVKFEMPCAASGSFNWTLKKGASLVASGTLNNGNNYAHTENDLDFGVYLLDVDSGARKIRFIVIDVDIDAMKVSHNLANGELPDGDETSPGAFVPINNDDDDYDASNTADQAQPGSIAGESDLLPIKLHKVDPAISGGKYTLDIPATVKIWQNSDRSGAVTGTTEFDANVDTTLYVEGVTVGSGNVKINWKDGSNTLDDCDEIKITVFNWLGPLNVPGYAIYQYKANGALGTSKWITPSSGTIKTGANSSDVTILWDAGPVVGKAIYHVNTDYVWDLEVNVVQVKLKAGASNKITYGNPPVQAGSLTHIHSTGGTPPPRAIVAELTIEKIEGPSVSGNRRGVKFIEMGFAQDVMITRSYGNFDGFTPKRKRQWSLQDGARHLDGNPAGTVPWYDPTGVTVAGARGFFAQPLSDATVNNTAFKIGDRPTLPATDVMTLAVPPYLPQLVNSFELEIDFDLYFAVRTIDSKNGANVVYTQRGSSSWEFDGSGTINGFGAWTQTGSGNTGSASFTEVTSGAAVPTTTLPWVNIEAVSATWSTELQ